MEPTYRNQVEALAIFASCFTPFTARLCFWPEGGAAWFRSKAERHFYSDLTLQRTGDKIQFADGTEPLREGNIPHSRQVLGTQRLSSSTSLSGDLHPSLRWPNLAPLVAQMRELQPFGGTRSNRLGGSCGLLRTLTRGENRRRISGGISGIISGEGEELRLANLSRDLNRIPPSVASHASKCRITSSNRGNPPF